MPQKLLVIGGTAAGLSAASKARRLAPDMQIDVIEKTGFISYGSCGLPYFVGGMIDTPDELISLSPDQAQTERNINVHMHVEALSIDTLGHTVRVRKLENGEEQILPYDKLVLATGAKPIVPHIAGIQAKGVYYLRSVEDGIRLKRTVQSNGNQVAAIVGGGFIGLEVAEQLANAGITVHIFEMLPRLLPALPESFSETILQTLTNHGVHAHLGVSVDTLCTQQDRVTGVTLSDGTTIPADFILMSIGVLPQTELAKNAGLTLGLKGGIVVDDEMRTSDPDILACGDCVQMKNRITGVPVYVPLGTTANKQGRIAGGNAAGLHDTFPGVLGSSVTKVFELYIAATGLSLAQATQAGFDAVQSIITKNDRASYYPGGSANTLCLILDRSTGRLLGAQGIGSESVVGRINVFAAAITANMTVAQVNELDLVYAPPVAPVYDPVLIAASQAMKHVKK